MKLAKRADWLCGPLPDYDAAMPDLTDPRAIKLKGALFLCAGILAAGLLLAETPTWRTALLLAICVWSFCRLYYFAFYVIERYVDPGYKFSGLGSFIRYWLRQVMAGKDR